MNPSPASVSGFTLSELLIVVAIAAIMATLAVPSFKSLTQSQQVKNATFELYSALSLARSEAIKRNIDVTLTGVPHSVSFPPPTHDELGWIITVSGVTIQEQSQLKGIQLTVEPSVPSITFQRTGRTTATTAANAPTFLIDIHGTTTPYARCIKIELSGMPRIYKKPASGSCR